MTLYAQCTKIAKSRSRGQRDRDRYLLETSRSRRRRDETSLESRKGLETGTGPTSTHFITFVCSSLSLIELNSNSSVCLSVCLPSPLPCLRLPMNRQVVNFSTIILSVIEPHSVHSTPILASRVASGNHDSMTVRWSSASGALDAGCVCAW